MSGKTMIFHTPNGKIAGVLKNGVYSKLVNRDYHLFKNLNAWGIEKSIVDKIKDDCYEIKIRDTATNTVYITTIENFIENSIPQDWGTPQLFLPLKFWGETNINQPTLI